MCSWSIHVVANGRMSFLLPQQLDFFFFQIFMEQLKVTVATLHIFYREEIRTYIIMLSCRAMYIISYTKKPHKYSKTLIRLYPPKVMIGM